MKTLVVTVGLPRSGKSTWARSTGHPTVCPDSIRLALHGLSYAQEAEPFVWAIAHMMVKALFISGHETVILDATSISRKRRLEWMPDPKIWNKTVYETFLDVSKEECIRRAHEDGRPELVPIIERMAESDMMEGLETASTGGTGSPPWEKKA